MHIDVSILPQTPLPSQLPHNIDQSSMCSTGGPCEDHIFKSWSVVDFKCGSLQFVVVWSLSHVWLFVTPWSAARQASLSFTISQSLLRLLSIESVMPSNHLILCHPFLLLPSFFPSIRVFSSELALCIRWPKYWSFSFSISASNECSELISVRVDWFDLLVVHSFIYTHTHIHTLFYILSPYGLSQSIK